MAKKDILDQLTEVLEARKSAAADSSYVAGLYQKGLDAILKKVGEEATETVMAAKDGDSEKIVYETADLWFHTLVMLSHQGLSADDVLDELARRFGQKEMLSGATQRKYMKKTSQITECGGEKTEVVRFLPINAS